MRLRRSARRGPFQLTAIARAALVVLFALSVGACAAFGPGPGGALSWDDLPGWRDAPVKSAWPALLNSCSKLRGVDTRWSAICDDASFITAPDDAVARAFFERHFEPHLQRGSFFRSRALVTGYYEPLLHGNWTRTERYRYPIYRAPDDLLTVDLGALYPELKNKRVRGRLSGRRVVPYYSRGDIESEPRPLKGNELLWVDDPVALFVLQVQGSGRVQLPSGETVAIGYAEQNGYPYTAIGRTLVERAGFKLDEIDLPKIRAWLADHPEQAQAVMNTNQSYVFFALRDPALPGPLGAFGVPLFPERAIAVDPAYIPLGLPMWLDTALPSGSQPYRQLVFAHDTGGAIKGPLRADFFFGAGPRAEEYAGRMREPGKLYVLLPR
ncbi:MAG: murein transglycosylase A [Sulfurifustis sp.]